MTRITPKVEICSFFETEFVTSYISYTFKAKFGIHQTEKDRPYALPSPSLFTKGNGDFSQT